MYKILGYILPLFATVSMMASTPMNGVFERVYRNNFWNEGTNVAGIREDNQTVSNASFNAGFESGGFRDSYMSESQWNMGLGAKTITHLKRFSMIGSFAFDNTEANNMCGSMFVNPGFFPVDVMEFTPGRKTFQTYSILGGISVDLGSGWRIAGLLDYKSNNASKRKDLRYSSFNMDMKFAPAIMYKTGDLALGLSLIYKRNTETIDAEQIGTAQTAPFVFFDEGLMIGSYQAWTGSNTRLKEAGVDGLPLQLNTLGAGFQLAYGSVYADLSFARFKGQAGERQINWYRYSGFTTAALIGVRLDKHAVRLNVDYQLLSNRETVFDKVVSGGLTLVEEYGSNMLSQRGILDLKAEYEYLSSAFELRASVRANDRQTITAPLYPFVFSQDLLTFGVDIDMIAHKGAFDYQLQLGFGKGNVQDYDSSVSDNSFSKPYRYEEYYNIANEYLTAARLNAGLALRYKFAKGLYSELNARLTNAFALQYISAPIRYGLNFVFGYNF